MILFARQKGDLDKLLDGISQIKNLKENSKILITETCTHNTSHEDIGRVKIPKLLEKKLEKKFDFTFLAGKDFPENLGKFDLIIHCGGCMITRKNMENRINYCNNSGVKITNYGLVLAYLTGILEKAIKFIHCGGCMITRKNMENRINYCNNSGVKITNYGLVLAYLTGILEKAIKSII